MTNINIYNLETIYTTQKSFYGKAKVRELRNGSKVLYSYDTLVCGIDENNNIGFMEYHSQTTGRHINEFLQQNGHNKMTKKEIENFR